MQVCSIYVCYATNFILDQNDDIERILIAKELKMLLKIFLKRKILKTIKRN